MEACWYKMQRTRRLSGFRSLPSVLRVLHAHHWGYPIFSRNSGCARSSGATVTLVSNFLRRQTCINTVLIGKLLKLSNPRSFNIHNQSVNEDLPYTAWSSHEVIAYMTFTCLALNTLNSKVSTAKMKLKVASKSAVGGTGIAGRNPRRAADDFHCASESEKILFPKLRHWAYPISSHPERMRMHNIDRLAQC